MVKNNLKEFDINGIDMYDETFDFGTYVEWSTKPKDAYDKFMLWVAENLRFIRAIRGFEEAVVDFTGMVEKNIEAFDAFMNEANSFHYRPNSYTKKFTSDDEEFYDLYLMTLENLLIGNYSNEDYADLLKLLQNKA